MFRSVSVTTSWNSLNWPRNCAMDVIESLKEWCFSWLSSSVSDVSQAVKIGLHIKKFIHVIVCDILESLRALPYQCSPLCEEYHLMKISKVMSSFWPQFWLSSVQNILWGSLPAFSQRANAVKDLKFLPVFSSPQFLLLWHCIGTDSHLMFCLRMVSVRTLNCLYIYCNIMEVFTAWVTFSFSLSSDFHVYVSGMSGRYFLRYKGMCMETLPVSADRCEHRHVSVMADLLFPAKFLCLLPLLL